MSAVFPWQSKYPPVIVVIATGPELHYVDELALANSFYRIELIRP